jgi:hypothetical protein
MSAKADTIRMSRAVYDPAVREAVSSGKIDKMRSTLKRAKQLKEDTANLDGGIAELEAAIARLASR